MCNTFTAISDLNLLVSQHETEHMHFDESKYLFALSVIFFGQGVLMAMLRLFEPVFYVIGIRNMKIWILDHVRRRQQEEIENLATTRESTIDSEHREIS